MLKDALLEIFERDLLRLRDEISLYQRDEDLWLIRGEISNSAGNLCLHLLGNLNHFIGALLGETGYIRDRELEFSAEGVTRQALNEAVTQTIDAVKIGLNKLTAADFDKNFPVEKHGEIVKMDFMLLHLFGHFSYHLGQINYHRRLLGAESEHEIN
jgi:uncharacterized damage-inducible protein DinB